MINSINFGSSDKKHIRENDPNLECGFVRDTTDFFRKDLDWELLAETIKDSFESGTPIYAGASSDGSEVCSLKMILEKKAPLKKFPILAFDILKEKIEMAQQGFIDLKGDKSWGEFSDENKIKINVGDDIFQKNLVKVPTYEINGKVLNSFGLVYKMTEHLKNTVNFKVADVFEFTKQKFEKPCVFLLRNVWPYFKSEKQRELLENFEQNLPSKSLLVVGGYDTKYLINDFLQQKSFKPIESYLTIFPHIFRKK